MKPRQTQHGLSVPQQIKFRPLVRAGWLRHCLLNDVDHHARATEREWYENALLDAVKVASTRDLVVTADVFHDLMLHFAILAQDTEWITRLATEAERRVRWLIQQRLDELSYLENRHVPWEYAVQTYATMKFPLTLEETPVEYLSPCFMALDTAVRRKLHDRGMKRFELVAAVKAMSALEAKYA
jgi:hypothetical protein